MGTARIRVVQSVRDRSGHRVRAVSARDVPFGAITADTIAEPEYVAALIEDAVRELDCSERRCVAAVGSPASQLRVMALPVMTTFERIRTARFEMSRFIDYPVEEAIVRVHRVGPDSDLWAIGVIRARTLRARAACLRRARLRLRAIEDEGCALRLSLPDYDAILDIGQWRSTVYPMKRVETFQIASGGAAVTAAIARDLNLENAQAEKRKRILGTAGAGERAKADLVAALAALIDGVRNVTICQRLAVVGNGSRLPGLLTDLAAATGCACDFAVSHVLDGETYSKPTTRSAAPDWTLAAALAR